LERRLALVDALRFLSLLVVLAVHLASAEIVSLPAEGFARELWLNFARNGSYGVTLFFVISGFVITRTILAREADLARIDVRAFYVRRLSRIGPALALFVALGATLWSLVDGLDSRSAFTVRHPAAVFDAAFWISIPSLLFNWLLISRESQAPGFGLHWDVLWSLAIEEQFYLAYPWLLRRAGNVTDAARWLFAFVVLGPFARYLGHLYRPDSFLAMYTNSFAAFEQIAIGALVGFALRDDRLRGRWDRGVAVLGFAGLVLVYWKTTLAFTIDRIYGPTLLAFAAATTLFFGLRGSAYSRASAPEGPPLDCPGTPRLSFLTTPGQWSYGGYLTHALVLFALWPLLAGRSAWPAFAAYAVATFALSGASYRLFEEPLNRLLRARL
jgi:peptidoglycan/LPS O-acetylase OafA/YrhL